MPAVQEMGHYDTARQAKAAGKEEKGVTNGNAAEKIIVALDVHDEKRVYKIVNDLGDAISFFKVGKELFVSEGPDMVNYLINKGKKVFLDLKFHDIPNTVAKAVASLVRLNVDLFTVHASGGKEMMRAAVDAVKKEVQAQNSIGNKVTTPKILAVTVLTSLGRDDLIDIGIALDDEGQGSDIEAQVKRLALLAHDAGVDGVVASPKEISMLRETLGDDMLIVTPGIRPASFAKIDDQKRVMTPREAIDNGADYIVVGRPILTAFDPHKAATEIIEEIT